MSEGSSKKRKKGYYKQGGQSKRGRFGLALQPGQKGFLITCNNREKEAVKEAYNILGESAEKIYGPEQPCEAESSSEEEEDIEAALKKEVDALKDRKRNKRRFQVVDSGAKNCVFIKTTLGDPHELLLKLLHEVLDTQKARSRFIMRIHPVIGSCKADEEKVGKLAEDLLAQYMQGHGEKSYCILMKVRNNTDFGKKNIFPVMRRVIQDMNPLHRFDDKEPDYVFFVDVIKSVCCLSVMKDYYKLRKYNVQEIVKVGREPQNADGDRKSSDQTIQDDPTKSSGSTNQDDPQESSVQTNKDDPQKSPDQMNECSVDHPEGKAESDDAVGCLVSEVTDKPEKELANTNSENEDKSSDHIDCDTRKEHIVSKDKDMENILDVKDDSTNVDKNVSDKMDE